MANNSRKRVIVHKQIQLTLIRRLIVHWVIFVLATCAVTTFLQFLLDPLPDAADSAFRFRLTIGSTLLVAVCLAPIFIRDTVRLSHRVVGPLIRLRGAIQKVGLGPSDRIHLRKFDYWKELIQDYNDMVDRLETQSAVPRSESSRPEPSEPTTAPRVGV